MAVTYKKRLTHPKINAVQRRIFQTIIGHYKQENRPIVYIDESGFAHDMLRTHGYAPKGRRIGRQKGHTNAIGALIGKALLTVGLFKTNINADIFIAWIKQDLLPKLPENAVLVMDNATFHKRKDTIQAIEQAGHTPMFLPPYSPDLNPIKHKWVHIKANRRKSQNTVETIFQNESLYMT